MTVVQSDNHADIRDANVWTFSQEDADLDIADAFDIAILTGTKEVEIDADYEAIGGSVQITFYKGATITAETGTEVDLVNECYKCNLDPLTSVLFNPTVTEAGTAIQSRKLRSAANVPARATSYIGDSAPRVLAPNTQYLIRAVSAVDGVDFGAYVRITER